MQGSGDRKRTAAPKETGVAYEGETARVVAKAVSMGLSGQLLCWGAGGRGWAADGAFRQGNSRVGQAVLEGVLWPLSGRQLERGKNWVARGDCCSSSRSNDEFVSKDTAVRTSKGRDSEGNMEMESWGLLTRTGWVGGKMEPGLIPTVLSWPI